MTDKIPVELVVGPNPDGKDYEIRDPDAEWTPGEYTHDYFTVTNNSAISRIAHEAYIRCNPSEMQIGDVACVMYFDNENDNDPDVEWKI